jgi:hypothetical protein
MEKKRETGVKLSDHPQVTRTFLSFQVSWPDPVCHRILVVETTLPLSEEPDGFDHAQLESFVEFMGERMEEDGADKAEIFSKDGAWGIDLKKPESRSS